MTDTPATRSHIITSTRLYAAAILAIGMAIPHAAIGVQAHWPGQLMSLHVLAIVLLLFAGRSTELAEARRSRAPDAAGTEFDQITQQLRNHDR